MFGTYNRNSGCFDNADNIRNRCTDRNLWGSWVCRRYHPQNSGSSCIISFWINWFTMIVSTSVAFFPAAFAKMFNSLSFLIFILFRTIPVRGLNFNAKVQIFFLLPKINTFISNLFLRVVLQFTANNIFLWYRINQISLSVTAYQPPALLHCVGGYLFNHVFQIHNPPIGRNPPRHNSTGNVPVPGNPPKISTFPVVPLLISFSPSLITLQYL